MISVIKFPGLSGFVAGLVKVIIIFRAQKNHHL